MGVGTGSLDGNQKYVVVLEFYGPAHASVTKRFRKALTKFIAQHGAREKLDVRATKRRGDPRAGLERRRKKPKRGR